MNSNSGFGRHIKRQRTSIEMEGSSVNGVVPAMSSSSTREVITLDDTDLSKDSFKAPESLNVATNMFPLVLTRMPIIQRIKVDTFTISSKDGTPQLNAPRVFNEALLNFHRLRQETLIAIFFKLRPHLVRGDFRDVIAYDSAKTLFVPQERYTGKEIEELTISKSFFEPETWKTMCEVLGNEEDKYLVRLTCDGLLSSKLSKMMVPANRLELIKCIETVISQKLNYSDFFHAGNLCFARCHNRLFDWDPHTEVRSGFCKSVVYTQGYNGIGQFMINTDIKLSVFHKSCPVLDLLAHEHKTFKKVDGTTSIAVQKDLRDNAEFSNLMEEALKKLCVTAKHLGKGTHLIEVIGISEEDAVNQSVTLRDISGERLVSIAEYYSKVYNIRLEYPNMRLLIGKLFNQEHFYPMEVLEVAPFQRKALKDRNCGIHNHPVIGMFMSPNGYIPSMERILKEQMKLKGNSLLSNFGIESRGWTAFYSKAKLLPCPQIKFGQEVKTLEIGSSEIQHSGMFDRPATIRQGAIISFNGVLSKREGGNFADKIEKICSSKGIQVESKFTVHQMNAEEHERIRKAMIEWKKQKFNIVIGVVKDEKSDIYNVLKFQQALGVQTMLISSATVEKIMIEDQKTLEKVTRKLNVKCGGTNFVIDIPKSILSNGDGIQHKKLIENVQFIGLTKTRFTDVISGTCSIVAATFNVSDSTRLTGHSSEQTLNGPKIDVIDTIISRCLRKYEKHSTRLPSSIVIYRNVMNKNEFEIVKKEVNEIRNSFKHREDNYCPSLIVLAVNKVPQVRMVTPANENVLPGTYIEETTSFEHNEFILNSQVSSERISSPVTYTILANDEGWTKNEIAHMTWFNSFTNQTSYMPFPVVSVLHFADKLANRAMNIRKYAKAYEQ